MGLGSRITHSKAVPISSIGIRTYCISNSKSQFLSVPLTNIAFRYYQNIKRMKVVSQS